MWGGIYAVLFSISTLLSYENPLKNGFTKSTADSLTKYTWSNVEFQNKIVGKEVQYSFYENKKFGPLQRGQSISITDQGGIWTGYGFVRKIKLKEMLHLNFDFFPGIYLKNGEEDLGGWLMFRSGIELEYTVNTDWSISLGYDHRSSGDIWEYNPGMETIKLSVSKFKI
jgi:hypothetical protein|tara:strand:- start:409 stop:915 length:507 start_codon:yes stop_codon:yes gene_type:complete